MIRRAGWAGNQEKGRDQGSNDDGGDGDDDSECEANGSQCEVESCRVVRVSGALFSRCWLDRPERSKSAGVAMTWLRPAAGCCCDSDWRQRADVSFF